VGSLAKPVPPVTRFNDATRHLVQMMARFGFGGAQMIASHLALAGFRIAEKTVRNVKREKVAALAAASPSPPTTPSNPVVANFVHHVWMMDVTEFKTLFGARTLYFAAVLDAFSRVPLAGMTSEVKPSGAAMARLCRSAATFGRPKYLITDLGGEFIADVFKRAVKDLGTKHRFASADSIRATARLERFWKTLKEIARVRLVPPLNLADLEGRLGRALAYDAIYRPHTGLENRTPLQVFLGATTAAPLRALPRGRKGEASRPMPIRISIAEPGFPGLGVLTPLAA